MKTLDFRISINATAAKVWQILWSDSTYRKWTSPFQEGSYAVSDWKEGSKIQFLAPKGGGMYGIIDECKPKERMVFKHLGVVKNFEEQPLDEETKSWTGAKERYILTEENGNVNLHVSLDAVEQFQEYFEGIFPKALAVVKELAEHPVVITVEATINASVEKTWAYWTEPKHITQWTNASDDWHAPRAENDLKVGGEFFTRMEAKDGSFGFDFTGVYDEVKINERIAYSLADGRRIKIDFIKEGDTCKVIEAFDAEEENTIELQKGGWQAILNNFKKYIESNV